jgi:hypothetical protein
MARPDLSPLFLDDDQASLSESRPSNVAAGALTWDAIIMVVTASWEHPRGLGSESADCVLPDDQVVLSSSC